MAEGSVGHFQEVGGLTSHSPGSLKSRLQVLFFHLGDLAFKVEAFGGNLNFLWRRSRQFRLPIRESWPT